MGVEIDVNGRIIEANGGETILEALNRHGMQVPTICNIKGLSPTGACRMCVVEVEGTGNLVPACSFPVERPLKIRTHSPRVLRARKTNVELLLSNHPDDCLYCERNGSCELQSLAEQLQIRERRIPGRTRRHKIDNSSPAIVRDPGKCILCGRCVRICEEIMHTSTLDFAHRGNELRISTTLARPLNFSNCIACGQCVNACPTGALIEHVQFQDLEAHIHDPGKTVAVQIAPSVAVSVGENLGFKPGTDVSGIIYAVLRRYGFDYIFETSFGADVMITEQVEVLKKRREPFPLLTSSCPAWIQYVEQFEPDLIPSLSPLRSPLQVTGSLIRDWYERREENGSRKLVSVAVTSCTAAKKEARRVEMAREGIDAVDVVITTRELSRLIRLSGLDLNQMEPEAADEPFISTATSGKLTGVAGGEAEATMRTLYHSMTGQHLSPSKLHRFRVNRAYREMSVQAGNREIRMGCVSGLANAAGVLEEIRNGKKRVDLLEVMACLDGCINGGGQPLPADEQLVRARSKAIYDRDNSGMVHTPGRDPALLERYKTVLGKPGDRLCRELFHTTFQEREVFL